MSTNQSHLSEVHLNLDPYQAKHSGFYFTTKGNREVITLGTKTLRENIFNWLVNPFNPGERNTLEDGSSVNSQYTLTVHGPQFMKTYLQLMRNGAQRFSQLNCIGDIQLVEADIPWDFQNRINKFLEALQLIGANFPIESIRVIDQLIDVYVNSNIDIYDLERELAGKIGFEKYGEGDAAYWVYNPFGFFGAQFRLVPVHEQDFSVCYGVLMNIDNEKSEYVDIRTYNGELSDISYQFWSLNQENFCSYISDYLIFRYQMPYFANILQQIYQFMNQENKGFSRLLKHLTEAAIKNNANADKQELYDKMVSFICLGCSSHIYEITEASSITIRKGFRKSVTAVVYPRIALKNQMLHFRCSRDGVVAVKMNNGRDGEGIAELEAIGVGEVDVYFYDGVSDRSFGSVSVEVNDPSYCKGIIWNQKEVVLPTDSKLEVGIVCEPSDALDIPRLKWSTNNRKVAFADKTGTVYAQAPGTAILTVEGEDVSAQMRVIVKPRIKSVKTDQDRFEAYVNQFITLRYQVEPQNCYDNSVSLSIEDPAVVTWNRERGQFQARSQGETCVKLYATSNPEIYTTIWIKVSFVPEPPPPVIRSFYTLTILWFLLCWTSYIPMIIYALQVYFAFKAVVDERKNVFIVALIIALQILVQLYIL